MEDAILITLATIATGLVGLIIRYSFRSKCEDFNCCFGCLKFHRDVKSEKTEVESSEEIKQN